MDEKFQQTATKEELSKLATQENLDKVAAKLVTYQEFDKRIGGIEKDFTELKESFNILQTSIDGYAKKSDGYFQEMLALSLKVDRHEKWLMEIAKKLDLKPEY